MKKLQTQSSLQRGMSIKLADQGKESSSVDIDCNFDQGSTIGKKMQIGIPKIQSQKLSENPISSDISPLKLGIMRGGLKRLQQIQKKYTIDLYEAHMEQVMTQDLMQDDKSFHIMHKHPSKRSLQDNKFILKLLRRVKFFEELERDHGVQTAEQCCQYLRFKQIQAGMVLFQQGDVGDEFYIIIQGSVSVLVSSYEHVTEFPEKPVQNIRKKGFSLTPQQSKRHSVDSFTLNQQLNYVRNQQGFSNDISPKGYQEKNISTFKKRAIDSLGFQQISAQEKDLQKQSTEINQRQPNSPSNSIHGVYSSEQSIEKTPLSNKLLSFQKISNRVMAVNRIVHSMTPKSKVESQKPAINSSFHQIQSSPLIQPHSQREPQGLDDKLVLQQKSISGKEDKVINQIKSSTYKEKQVQQVQQPQKQEKQTQETIYVAREVKVLKNGDSFGELSLLRGRNAPRAATIKAKELTYLVYIVREDFLNILKDKESQKIQENINFLSKIALFHGLEDNILRQIYINTHIREYKREQVVFQQGQESDALFIVRQGDFSIYKNKSIYQKSQVKAYQESNIPAVFSNQYGKHEKQMKITIMSNGFVFGFEDILLRVPRNYSVKCETTEGVLIAMNQISKVLQDRFHKQLEINENFYLQQELRQHELCKQYTKYMIAVPTNKKIQSLKKQLNTLVVSSKIFTPTTHFTNNVNQIQQNKIPSKNRTNLEYNQESSSNNEAGVDDTSNCDSFTKTKFQITKGQFQHIKTLSSSTQLLSLPITQRNSFYDAATQIKHNNPTSQIFYSQYQSPQQISVKKKQNTSQGDINAVNSPTDNNMILSSGNYQNNQKQSDQCNHKNINQLMMNDQLLLQEVKSMNLDQIIEQDDSKKPDFENSEQHIKYINRININDSIQQAQANQYAYKNQIPKVNPINSFYLPTLKQNISKDQDQILNNTCLNDSKTYNISNYQAFIENPTKGVTSPLIHKKTRNQSLNIPAQILKQTEKGKQQETIRKTQYGNTRSVLQGFHKRSQNDLSPKRNSKSVDFNITNNQVQQIQTRDQSFDQTKSQIKLFLDPSKIKKRNIALESISKKEIPTFSDCNDLVNLVGELKQGDENFEIFQKRKNELETILLQKESEMAFPQEESYQDQQNKYIFGHYHQLKRKHEQFKYYDSIQEKIKHKCKLNKSEILNDFFNNCQKNQEIFNKVKKKKEQWKFSKYYDLILNPGKYAEKIIKKISIQKREKQ